MSDAVAAVMDKVTEAIAARPGPTWEELEEVFRRANQPEATITMVRNGVDRLRLERECARLVRRVAEMFNEIDSGTIDSGTIDSERQAALYAELTSIQNRAAAIRDQLGGAA